MLNHPRESNLIKGFREFNSRQRLFATDDRILLAISGGIDSVAMLHLFLGLNNQIAVIHCNFQLRSSDSDEDEAFVRNLCSMNNLPCFSRRFNTLQFAEENNLSIQLAARELRYAYFEEIRQQEGYDRIAIAHNSDDSIETFFINLMRGTGIKGLTGIKASSGRIIRPLLFASRNQIVEFAKEIKMLHRLDKSNLENKYKRNQVRNELMPLLENMAPSFRKTMLEVLHKLDGTNRIYQERIEELMKDLVQDAENFQFIDMDSLKKKPYSDIVLPELLRKFGFSADICQQIILNLDSESGTTFLSPTHRLIKDRNRLLLTGRSSAEDEVFYIDENIPVIELPLVLRFFNESRSSGYRIPREKDIACIDKDKLVFPLMLRHWKNGDYFRPLGMEQMKKLSDYFIDEKFSIPEKEQAWLLLSDGKIVWICGHRLDERFKISESTRNILRIEMPE